MSLEIVYRFQLHSGPGLGGCRNPASGKVLGEALGDLVSPMLGPWPDGERPRGRGQCREAVAQGVGVASTEELS